MAITRLSERPGLGEMIGTGLGSGLSSGLNSLAKLKLDQLKQKHERAGVFESLTKANIPENIANAIVNVPKSMQREVFKSLMKLDKGNQGDQGNDNNLYSLRRKLMTYAKKNGKDQNALKEKLSSIGISPEESELLIGKKLDDKAVIYFLNKTNNDPKKARKLAKKFGYEV